MARMAEDWSNLPESHSLSKFAKELLEILTEAEYSEMYGVDLKAPEEGWASFPYDCCA